MPKRNQSKKAKKDSKINWELLYSGVSILFLLSISVILVGVAVYIFMIIYQQYNLLIVGPAIIAGIGAYFIHLYIKRIDSMNERVIFLEGKIQGYDNARIIETLLKSKRRV